MREVQGSSPGHDIFFSIFFVNISFITPAIFSHMYMSTCKISLDDHEEEKIAQVGKNLGGTPKTRGEN